MDRLSCFPDDVICHILSFLPTKRSMQTSLVSKRWRFLWAHVASLEFRIQDFRTVYIVTKIVLSHKHNIHTFRLLCSKGFCSKIEEEFESWIVNITTRNIRNLGIASYDYCFMLPQCLFTCKTLVHLILRYYCEIPTSGIYLPALKKLKLDRVDYESDESLAHLISGCPVLEELKVVGEELSHCCVSSPTITKLVFRLDRSENLNFWMKLDTPALRYLQLDCFIPGIFSVGALDSLIEADIHFFRDEEHQDNLVYLRNVLAFVGKLYNVKLSTLSTCAMGVIFHDSAFPALAVKLDNLTKLDLGVTLGFITYFLENASNLQVLKLRILNNRVDSDNQYGWMEPKQVP